MELLKEFEINSIIKHFGLSKSLKWDFEEFPDKIIGYLGDHLKLFIEADNNGGKTVLKFFVKCMPRFDAWKLEYLKELKFFKKEFIMLSELFKEFQDGEGLQKWRPKLLYIREDLFVFEDVTQLGYKMPHHQETMTLEELKATVVTLARFHSQSYIFEERRSQVLNRPYRIWEDFSEYLQEPEQGQDWRDTGRNAVIDFLKQFSKYKSKPNFCKKIDLIIPLLFDEAMALMKPSKEYRNVVVHRDLWSNNVFIKREENSLHALIVDYQTVLYSSPTLDLSSLIYFNTLRADRDKYSDILIDVYYETLSIALKQTGLDVDTFFSINSLKRAYDESLIFGITQAAIIVPIIAMNSKKREEIFCDPERSIKANIESRSDEFIEIANEDIVYYNRVSELFDELVERFVYPLENNYNSNGSKKY